MPKVPKWKNIVFESPELSSNYYLAPGPLFELSTIRSVCVILWITGLKYSERPFISWVWFVLAICTASLIWLLFLLLYIRSYRISLCLLYSSLLVLSFLCPPSLSLLSFWSLYLLACYFLYILSPLFWTLYSFTSLSISVSIHSFLVSRCSSLFISYLYLTTPR